jgi:hypothetical protein
MKGRYIAGGHPTEMPAAAAYASIISRGMVQVVLPIAALNDLEALTGDVHNMYTTAPLVTEKIRVHVALSSAQTPDERQL